MGATVRALASSFFEVWAQYEGSWTDLRVPQRWDISHLTGIPAGGWSQLNGRLVGPVLLSQDGEYPDTSNPAQGLWQGIWTPNDFTPRNAGFNTAPIGIAGLNTGSKLWVTDSTQPPGYHLALAYMDVTPSFISFSVVPAPAAALIFLFALAGVGTSRRR